MEPNLKGSVSGTPTLQSKVQEKEEEILCLHSELGRLKTQV